MICEDKKTNDNWKQISPATICCRLFCPPLHLIPVWLNSPFPIITKKLSKIFSNTERRKLCSVRNGSSVSTAVNERGEGLRVPLSLYERTFFSVLHFHFMTTFQTRRKRRRVFPFPNNHRRPSKVLTTLILTFFSTFSIRPSIFFFLFLQRLSSLFFYFFCMALHSLTSSLPDRSRMPPVSVSESDNSTLRYECDETFSRTSIVRNFISRGVKMRISAREACVKPHLRTRSDIKIFIDWGMDSWDIFCH